MLPTAKALVPKISADGLALTLEAILLNSSEFLLSLTIASQEDEFAEAVWLPVEKLIEVAKIIVERKSNELDMIAGIDFIECQSFWFE